MSRRIGVLAAAINWMLAATVSVHQASAASPCALKDDRVLTRDAVFPDWIPWQRDCLRHARIVYTRTDTWEVWVMDATGGHQRCLTCQGDNAVGVDFPLDVDKAEPAVHWKGAAVAHPTAPVVIFSAENEHTQHAALRNTPSMGWDNDLWALNVCTKRYTRLTRLGSRQGVQHAAISGDGKWYVYPLRTKFGKPLKDFGLARMVFSELTIDNEGDAHLQSRFEAEPNGAMYYEPHDVLTAADGTRALLYSAGSGNTLRVYRYRWRCGAGGCGAVGNELLPEAVDHVEFTMSSPSETRVAWMGGPLVGFGYHSDLYVSATDLSDVTRVTYYNDCKTWPLRCKRNGAQLSPIAWAPDGRAAFFGLWIHAGRLRPARRAELHRVEFVGDCGTVTSSD